MGRRPLPRCTDFKSIPFAHARDICPAKSACLRRSRPMVVRSWITRYAEAILTSEPGDSIVSQLPTIRPESGNHIAHNTSRWALACPKLSPIGAIMFTFADANTLARHNSSTLSGCDGYLQDPISNTTPATRKPFWAPTPRPGAPNDGDSGVSNCLARARLFVRSTGPWAYTAMCTEEPAETWQSRSVPLNVS